MTGRLFGPWTTTAGRWLLFLWAFTILAGLVIIAWPEGGRVPLVLRNKWKVDAGFLNNGEPGKNDLPGSVLNSPERMFWRSWSPQKNASRGRLESAAFKPAGSTIALPVVGYPAAPGNLLYLENQKTRERLTFHFGNAHETWQELVIRIPDKWRRKPLKIVAESGDRAYMGVGTPFQATRITDLKTSLPAALAWHAIVCCFLMAITALPRAALALLEPSLGRFASWFFFPLALALLGYSAFFTYGFSPRLTVAAAAALVVAGIVRERNLYRAFFLRPVEFSVRHPALLAWLLVSLVSWLCLNAQQTVSLAFAANYRFTPASWSTDNQLPVLVAEALSRGAPLQALNFGAWQVSDRPPAFTGILAILCSFSSPLFSPEPARQLFVWLANLTGIAVMAAWVFPLWALLRRLGIFGLNRIWILGIFALTPFVFFNTVYAWPKMLSGSLALTAWVLLDPFGKRNFCPRSGVGAGLAFAGALLSHGGIFSSHLAMGLWLAFTQLRRRWATLLVCGVCFFATVATWLVWVHEVNPPGNALAKYAFAGTFGFENRHQSLFDAVSSAYRKDTAASWYARKLEVLKSLVGLSQNVSGSHTGWPDEGLEIRRLQFFNLLPALGILLICLAAVFLRSARGSGREMHTAYAHLAPRTLLLIGLLSVAVQLFLFWGPFTVFELSYGATLALHTGFLILALRFGRTMLALLTISLVLNFFCVWLISPVIEFGHIRPATLTLAIILTLIPCMILICLAKQIPHRRQRGVLAAHGPAGAKLNS